MSSTTLAAAAAKPEDAPAALAAAPGKPSFSIKAPALRKATRDEVEELNETFRTEGSRDRVLRRIELASAEDRQRIVAYYNSVVTKNLEGEDNQRAKAKLATTLARAAAK